MQVAFIYEIKGGEHLGVMMDAIENQDFETAWVVLEHTDSDLVSIHEVVE